MASNVNIDEFLLSGDGSSRASVETKCSLMLLKMLEEGLHADITINANGGSVKAHRCVLASVSPVFNAMFDHPMLEQLTSTVELPEMSIQGLHLFLVLIYILPDHDGTVASFEFATSCWHKHFDELIEACCTYQVKKLAPVLTFHLTIALNPERCWDYLRKSEPLSELCGILDYKASESGPYAECDAYIRSNFNKVIEAESFRLEMQNDPMKVQLYIRSNFNKVIEAESFRLEMQNDPMKVQLYLIACFGAPPKICMPQQENPSLRLTEWRQKLTQQRRNGAKKFSQIKLTA